NFPDDSKASTARVHRGMAKMRQAVDGARNWSNTLDTAKSLIGEISTEKDFGEARKELAALLPKIAAGLADQAREQRDASLVDKSKATLKLIDKYVPKTLMPTQKVADVTASLGLTERILGRDAALATTLKAIQQAIAENQPQKAYAERKQLLKNYPDLLSNEQLQKAVLSLSEAEQQEVRYVAENKPAAAAADASPVEVEVVLANRRGSDAPGMAGRMTYALAGGAAFALQAADGKVLWRRFVGYDADFTPLPIAPDPASDVLISDAARNEIARVEAASGQVRWRHVVGEPFDAHPVLSRNQVWVATRSGRLVVIDLESGDSPGYVKLPQGMRVGPAFDSRGQTCYQLGENSNLFVISPQSHECREVLYLGHEPESVRVPPLVVSPYVFVCENRGADDAVMHVLLTDEQGLSLRPAQASVTLSGHVQSPPVVAGRTLVVTTDRGAIYSFEINAPDPGPPLTKVAEKPADDSAPLARYALLRNSQLWIAGLGLTRFDIQQARGRLEPKWIHDEGDTFLAAPTVEGDVVFLTRRKKNQSEVLVSATKAGDGSRYWEAQLAAPPAGTPMTGKADGVMTVLNTAGSLFEVPTADLSGRVIQDRAVASTDVEQSFPERASPAVLADGSLALAGTGQPKALIADDSEKRGLRWLQLPDPLGTLPIGFGGGLLAPGRLGQVFVLDPATGRQLIAPFQPRLSGDEPYAWGLPARLGEKEMLLADGRKTLFRLGTAPQPQPHLVALATAELLGPITAPLAVLEKTAYAVDGAGELRSYALPGLKAGPSWPLGGVQWGPVRLGDQALTLTSGGELVCFDDQRQQVWKVAWPHGPVAGAAVDKDSYLLASVSGSVLRIAAGSGAEQSKVDVGEPLGAGPVAVGNRLWLAGHGGTLLCVAAP
ncbi:MAG TPA: PQQ-binding-like beta-propeller repeat protein, partial [Pirellulales bacterium]|nr:PQQ-binding-like beta-propeller repeat protein [Pirellulales bacterium]